MEEVVVVTIVVAAVVKGAVASFRGKEQQWNFRESPLDWAKEIEKMKKQSFLFNIKYLVPTTIKATCTT